MRGGRSAAWPLRLVLACLAVATVGGFALDDVLAPDEVRLGEVRASVAGETLTVATSVLPGGHDGARYHLWYELTPAGADEPAFTSAAVSATTRAGEPNPVTLTDELGVRPGEYRLDVWLHLRRRDESVEVGHQRIDVDLSDRAPALLRSRPAGNVGVDPASTLAAAAEPGGPLRLTGTLVLRNHTGEARAAAVAVGALTDETDLTGEDRWIPPRQVVVPAGGTVTLAIDDALALRPGTYRPTAEVRSAGTVTDHATAATAVAVEPAPGLTRAQPPPGDVMITAAELLASWRDATASTIAVTVANLTDAPRDVTIQPVAAPAGPAPWAISRLSCRHGPVELAPYETRAVPVRCLLASPAEPVELTVWAHAAPPGTAPAHSDTVRAAAAVAVTPNDDVRHLTGRALGAVLVESVDAPTRARTDGPLGLTATVRNATDRELSIAAWWVVDRDGSATHHDSVGERRYLRLAPGERREVWLGGTVLAGPGEYELSVAVHTRTGPDLPWQHGDQGWSPSRIGIETR